MAQRQLSQASRFKAVMTAERDKLDEKIQALTERRDSIDELLDTYNATEGNLFEKPAQQKSSERKIMGHKKGHSKKSLKGRTLVTQDKKGALEKIRALMFNAQGRTLSKEDISTGVKQMYGVELPSSWQQMLYRRVRANKTFYNNEGRFGLIEHRARVETVSRVPETATA
jgi:hypothetical protein